MSLDFKVTYSGSVPGLSEHRLSMSAFAKALERLTIALQRTASGLVSGQKPDRGRIAEEARALDFELEGVEDNCVTVCMTAVARRLSPQTTLGPMLIEEALKKLSADIQGECDDAFTNPAVRRYLEALPSGLTEQRYRVFKDGELVSDVRCGPVARVEQPDARLVKMLGQIVGVGFPPGPMYVYLKGVGEKPLRLRCTDTQLRQALALRDRFVHAAVMLQNESRLLWVRTLEDNKRPSFDESVQHLQANWSRTLDQLAQ